jgi:hypothetical protein
MADPDLERLLASYGDLGEAMVAENVLRSGGVPCRVGDLAGLPSHLLGSLGGINRSVGIWVLETDVQRAVALLADMEAVGTALDEEALAAEAMAAVPPGAPEARHAPAPQEPFASRSRRAWEARHAPGGGRVALVLAAAAIALVVGARGCA